MKNTIVRILSLLLILTFALAALAGCSSGDDDKKIKEDIKSESAVELLSKSVDRTVDKIDSREASGSPVLDSLEGGSVEFVLTVPQTAEISGKVYANIPQKQGAVVANIGVPMLGVNMDLGAHFTKDEFVISSDALLGGAYGVKYATIADDMKNSLFAPEKSAYSLDEEVFGQLLGVLEDLGRQMASGKSAVEDLKTTANKYVTMLVAALENNSEMTVSDKKIASLGSEFEAKVVTVKLTGEQIANIGTTLWALLKNDPSFKSLFTSLFVSASAEDAEGQLDAEIAKVFDEFRTMGVNASVSVALNSQNGAIARVDAKITYDGEIDGEKQTGSADISFECGLLDKFEGFKLTGHSDNDGEKDEFNVTLTADGEWASKREYKLIVDTDDTKIDGSLVFDKANESFGLTINHGTEQTEFSGKYTLTDSSATLEFNVEDTMSVKLTFNAKDTLPAVPEYVNIADMKEENLAIIASLFDTLGIGGSRSETNEVYGKEVIY